MLSATYTITDIKKYLLNDFSFYGYADDIAFASALTVFNEQAELMKVVPIIGRGQYTEIAALDRTGLSETQNYIYLSEIYFSMCEFAKAKNSADIQNVKGSSHAKSVDGVSETVGGGITQSGLKMAAQDYCKLANRYMSLAGYSRNSMARGGVAVASEFYQNDPGVYR